MENNSTLIQEKRNLEASLMEMETRMTQLYEDAEFVRTQVNQEIAEYKQSQLELNRLKKQNYILWRKIRVREINSSLLNNSKFEVDEMDEATYDNELDLIVQDSGIFKDIRLKRREFMSIATQTLDEREFRTHSLSERIETIIESNTKSIVGAISNNQLDNYYKIFRQNVTI